MFLLRDSVTPWPVIVKNGLDDEGRSSFVFFASFVFFVVIFRLMGLVANPSLWRDAVHSTPAGRGT